MVQALYPPSEGYGRSAENVALDESRNRGFREAYIHDLGRQVMEGVFFSWDHLEGVTFEHNPVDTRDFLFEPASETQLVMHNDSDISLATTQQSVINGKISVPEYADRFKGRTISGRTIQVGIEELEAGEKIPVMQNAHHRAPYKGYKPKNKK